MSTIIPAHGRVTVVMSAELDWRDADRNAAQHDKLRQRLARMLSLGELYSLAETEGAYKGVPEMGFAFTGRPGPTLAIGQHYAELFEQESILIVNSSGGGALRFTDRQEGDDDMPLGHYQACDADTCEAWTRVLATDETFTFT